MMSSARRVGSFSGHSGSGVRTIWVAPGRRSAPLMCSLVASVSAGSVEARIWTCRPISSGSRPMALQCSSRTRLFRRYSSMSPRVGQFQMSACSATRRRERFSPPAPISVNRHSAGGNARYARRSLPSTGPALAPRALWRHRRRPDPALRGRCRTSASAQEQSPIPIGADLDQRDARGRPPRP